MVSMTSKSYSHAWYMGAGDFLDNLILNKKCGVTCDRLASHPKGEEIPVVPDG